MIYTIKTNKSLGGANSREIWTNDYAIEQPDGTPITAATVKTAVDQILAHEQKIHCDQAFIKSATVSTRIKGDTSPTTVKTFGYGRFGGRITNAATNPMLPLEIVYILSLSGESGREGKKFYRGVLSQEDVKFTNGSIGLNGATGGGQFLRDDGATMLRIPALLSILRLGAGNVAADVGRSVLGVNQAGVDFRQRDRRGKSRAVTGETGINTSLDDILDLLGKILPIFTRMKTTGGITDLARILQKTYAVRVLTDGIAPPGTPQLPGN
jgi:hypothetical protein